MTSHEEMASTESVPVDEGASLSDRIAVLEALFVQQARAGPEPDEPAQRSLISSNDIQDLMFDLPSRVGLRDEARWLIKLLKDLRADKLDMTSLDLRILGRLKYLHAKDTWDDATCERIQNALDAHARTIKCEDDINIIIAKAKSKGFRSSGSHGGGRGKRKSRGRSLRQ